MSLVFHRLVAFVRSVRGNVAWVYGLALVPLTLCAGAGLDFISVVHAKTALQNAIDAAVLAGAGAGNSAAVAANVFAAEPLSKFGVAGTPTYTVNDDNSFTGKVSATMSTQFLSLLNINSLSVSVTATAKRAGTSAACVLILDRNASQALLMNGGADIEAPQCEVHVASNGSPAAAFNSQTSLVSAKICIAGTSILDNGGTHPNLMTGCTVAADPFAGNLPTPSTSTCTYSNGNYNGGTFTMSPGVYCGWFNFNGTNDVTFQPGVYVIKGGGWNVNGGTWTGDGVTFYFADSSKIQFNSGVKATLTAPTSGTYAGILMYEASGLSQSQFVLDDSKGHQLSGLIYLPSRQLTVNSGADLTTDQVTVVVDTLIVNKATWQITPPASKAITGSGASGSAYLVK